MKAIDYTDHLRLRLKVRMIPEEYPRKIYEHPEQTYLDTVEGTKIAIKKLVYNGKIRNIMIAYEDNKDKAKIITIHPITDEKIIGRVMRRRWIVYAREM